MCIGLWTVIVVTICDFLDCKDTVKVQLIQVIADTHTHTHTLLTVNVIQYCKSPLLAPCFVKASHDVLSQIYDLQ